MVAVPRRLPSHGARGDAESSLAPLGLLAGPVPVSAILVTSSLLLPVGSLHSPESTHTPGDRPPPWATLPTTRPPGGHGAFTSPASGSPDFPSSARTGLRVLLVEDNPDDVHLITEMLRSDTSSFEVEKAERLSQALKLLDSASFDIVLLDLYLPDVQGMATVTKALDLGLTVPVVVITGNDSEDLALEAVRAGAQDYLVKDDLDGRTLARTLWHAIERQQLVMALKAAHERVSHLATHDSLTGLPNRQLFFDLLDHSVSWAQRYNESLAVLFIDMDNFKVYNDLHGHAAGDQLLGVAGRAIPNAVRRTDTVARLGGDEFTVILPHTAQVQDVARVAEHIVRAIKESAEFESKRIEPTVSIGVALYPIDGEDASTLVRNADMAMYAIKRDGGNGYRFYTASLGAQAARRLGLERQLSRALEENEFVLHYQPQVDMASKGIVGVEALIRWAHPRWGMVLPADFIHIAEDTAQICSIGEWVLTQACHQAAQWRRLALPGLRLSVNLSCVQLRRDDVVDRVAEILDQTDTPPEQLVLEITETGILEDTESAVRALEKLRDLGLSIYIDDFGTGYSSLALLRQLPVDGLKIDRSFISNVASRDKDAQITEAIVAMADRLRLTVVAEGVETADQVHFLKALNCNLMQGFLFSEPLAPSGFQETLSQGLVWPV